MDEHRLHLVKEALKTVERYRDDPGGFMKRLAEGQFLLEDKRSIWEHFGALTSLSPAFADRYQKTVLREFKVPSKRFWSDYVEKIEDFLYYMSQVPGERSAILDRALNAFGGFSDDELAQLRATPIQRRPDLIDQLLKKKKKKDEKKEEEEDELSGKGIQGAKQPYTITSHPPTTADQHKKLQELGLEEKHEPQQLTTKTGETLTSQGTINTGQTFLTNEKGQKLTTSGPLVLPGQLVGPSGNPISSKPESIIQPTIIVPQKSSKPSGRNILLGPNEKPLTTGLEVLRAEEGTPTPKGIIGSLGIIDDRKKSIQGMRKILSDKQALRDAGSELKVGTIKGKATARGVIGEVGRQFAKEVGTLGDSGDYEEIPVIGYEDVPDSQPTSSGGRRISLRRRPKLLGKVKTLRKEAQEARIAAMLAKQAITKNPIFWFIIVVLGLFVMLVIMPDHWNMLKNTSLCGPDLPCGKTQTPVHNIGGGTASTLINMFKGGPSRIENGEDIRFNITLEYIGAGTANITLRDRIPDNATFDPAKQDPNFNGVFVAANAQNPNGSIEWTFQNLAFEKPQLVFLILTPTCQDCYVRNIATAQITGRTGYLGGSDNLLPNPLPDPPPNWDTIATQIRNNIAAHPDTIVALQEASAITGVPWEYMMGIFYVETGGAVSSTKSMTNGFPLGQSCRLTNSCDIPAAKCAPGAPQGQGLPIPAPGGGCTFATFLDSAIYEGNHIIAINGGQPVVTFFDAVTTASHYNGGGNSNCWWQNPITPYNAAGNCTGPGPRGAEFDGEDDPYAMADFDAKHASSGMYLIFCANNTRCSPPRPFNRPGVMAVVRAIATAQ